MRGKRMLRLGRNRSITAWLSPRMCEKSKTGKSNYQGIEVTYERTPEHRRVQAELIRKWKPWEKSTGPKSKEGKTRAAMRGFKGGWRKELRELRCILREQEEARRQVVE